MNDRFDKLSEQNASLQILIDQYNDADDYDDRDEVLQDIAAHPSEAASAFLKLVAEQDDDPSTRCDAWCALHKRQPSPESRAALLEALSPERPYELVKVGETFASATPDAEVAQRIWHTLATPLPREAQSAALAALESIDPDFVASAGQVLARATDPSQLDYDLLEGVVRALALQPASSARPLLAGFRQRVLDLAQRHRDDAVLLEELAAFVNETMQLFELGETKDDDDDDQ